MVRQKKAAVGQKTDQAKKAGTKAATKRPAKEEEAEVDKVALVKKLLRDLADELKKHQVKASVNDFIKLIELEKELECERPRPIEVTWVEPVETGPKPD